MDNKEIMRMLRIVLKKQQEFRRDVLKALHKLERDLASNFSKSTDVGFGKVNKSLDKLEKQILNLTDRRKLAAQKRMARMEKKVASV